MTDIVAVLVVPTAGDPGGLLAWGVLGARPPLVAAPVPERTLKSFRPGGGLHGSFAPDEVESWSQWHAAGDDKSEDTALPLWWEGALVPEGWDRAHRAWRRNGPGGFYPADPLDIHDAGSLADALTRIGLTSRVVRLTRVHGRLVEVP